MPMYSWKDMIVTDILNVHKYDIEEMLAACILSFRVVVRPQKTIISIGSVSGFGNASVETKYPRFRNAQVVALVHCSLHNEVSHLVRRNTRQLFDPE